MHSTEFLERLGTMPPKADGSPYKLMEICGTHTMAIAKAGLRQLLPRSVELISGPGCPVCVTPAGAIDELFRIASLPDVTVACYGDLLRIPGSKPGTSLLACRAVGADIRMVYSIMDALELAEQHPERQIVFPGVGFETTAPGTAVGILEASARGLKNFTVLSLLKYTLPAIHTLLKDPACSIDGFICPGHVATIIGSDIFGFLPKEYHLPAVVAGFEQEDVVQAVGELCEMLRSGNPQLKNLYPRAVKASGNLPAQKMTEQVLEPADSIWRGLGSIEKSGMAIRPEYAAFDAALRFGFSPEDKEQQSGCHCGSILKGLESPSSCPLFGVRCVPSDPIGPCMVSGEGACAAAYKYRSI